MSETPRTGDALGPSVVGTFDAPGPCTLAHRTDSNAADGTPLFDGEVCVPGGVYIFGGSVLNFGVFTQIGEPKRMARMPAFLIDKNEVTVGRWRAAVARGFVAPATSIAMNDAPLPKDAAGATVETTQCTYSSVPMGRESFPVNCVSWEAAREFCQFEGGDLPYEVQWTYVAEVVARPTFTVYPWGGPDGAMAPCSRAVFGRFVDNEAQLTSAMCVSDGFGPQPVDARTGPAGDLSVGLGVENLAGSVGEWLKDDDAALDSYCWMKNGLDVPHCVDTSSDSKESRGADWTSRYATASVRSALSQYFARRDVGFRCVRAGKP
jgi:formylglycine-generating enzyme required for sulfatase activity